MRWVDGAALAWAGVMAIGPAPQALAAPAHQDRAAAGTGAQAPAVEFDLEMLKNRGLGADVAEYFKSGARFRAGMARVTVFVNDQRIGQVGARFDDQGQVCFDEAFMSGAGLQWRDAPTGDKQPGCADFLTQYPNTIVKLIPGREEVRLIVPTDAIRPQGAGHRAYATGGAGAILNYDVLLTRNQSPGRSDQFRSIQSEAGFNAGDWVLRSRQSYVESAGRTRFDHLYAYGQKTFAGLGQTVQAGQISIANSLFAGSSITGVQWVPEAALQEGRQAARSLVSGIANSPARIEVRQSGSLIYTTVVPQGPFSLADIPLLNRSSDLHVSVIENNGGVHTFVVPAAELTSGDLGGTPGYSLALGKYRAYGSRRTTREPFIATGTGTWGLDKDSNVTAGLMAATDYYAVGAALNRAFTPSVNGSVRQVVSYSKDHQAKGMQTSVSLNSQIIETVSASLGATMQTPGFRDLGDVVNDDRWSGFDARYRMQYTGSIGWSNDAFGSVQGSYSRAGTFDGRRTQYFTAAWSKSIKRVTVSLNFQHASGGSDSSGNTVLLSVSIPLGPRSVRGYVNSHEGRTRSGASVSEQVNEYVGYDLSAEHDGQDRETSVSGNLSLLPRYFQASLGAARNGSSGTMYSGQLRGGVAIHGSGVTLSPYPINDTYAIAKVGDVAGVKIATPQGPVWTDISGRAVVPGLTPYRTSRLQVATPSLPRNVDLVNGYREIEAARGAVQRLDFGVVKTRRVLLRTKVSDGSLLARGVSVIDANGDFVTAVLSQGKVFLPGLDAPMPLRAEMSDGRQCELSFQLGDKPDVNNYYETVNAVCRLSDHG